MIDGYWLSARDGDLRALALYLRHYSAKKSRARYTVVPLGNRARFAGPSFGGRSMVLLSHRCDALFVWRFERYRRDGQQGVNCSVFRKEGPELASAMVIEAVGLAWRRWPGKRLFTFVDPGEIRSTNPGYCFKMAGFQFCGRTKRGLHVLEMLPMAVEIAA